MSPVDADANFAFLDMLWYETVYIISNIRRLHCYLQRTTLGVNVSLWIVSMRFTHRTHKPYLIVFLNKVSASWLENSSAPRGEL